MCGGKLKRRLRRQGQQSLPPPNPGGSRNSMQRQRSGGPQRQRTMQRPIAQRWLQFPTFFVWLMVIASAWDDELACFHACTMLIAGFLSGLRLPAAVDDTCCHTPPQEGARSQQGHSKVNVCCIPPLARWVRSLMWISQPALQGRGSSRQVHDVRTETETQT